MISLFAGIGGFDLGFEQAGFEVVAHVERDVNCRKLLAAKFPGADAFYDVREATGMNLPACDVLCGGWPCQDLSVAGKRAGLGERKLTDDEQRTRSGLFYEFARIADELRPAFLVWENVPGLFSSDQGRDMLRVVTEFQRIGFGGGWRTFDAQYFGLAQRRGRCFGVFARGDIGAGRCAEVLSLAEGLRGHPAPRREAGEGVTGPLTRSTFTGGGTDGNDGREQHLVCGTVSSKWAKGTGEPAGDECYNLVLGFPGRMSGTQCASEENLSPVLQAHNPTAVAFMDTENMDSGSNINIAPSMRAGKNHISVAYQPEPLAFSGRARGDDGRGYDRPPQVMENGVVGALDTVKPWNVVAGPRMIVRRLTPRECERLQGFPDDWTAGFSDSVRYRMLGNAVAVPCARWLAQRLFPQLARMSADFSETHQPNSAKTHESKQPILALV